MKRILIGITGLLLLLGSSKTMQGQNFSTEFLKQLPKKQVSVATVNSSMIEVLKKEETNKEFLAFLNELSFLRVITINEPRRIETYLHEGEVTTIKTDISTYCDMAVEQVGKYAQGEELLSVNDSAQQTLLMAFNKTADNKAGEIVFINCIGNTLTIVNITGNISIGNLKNLSNLSNSIKKL